MRIAALYDIHGNLPALEAVLAELEPLRPDEVVVGGDVVPGPMARECLRRLADLPRPVHFIAGNAEREVLAASRGAPSASLPQIVRDGVVWCAQSLEEDQLAAIARWPPCCELEPPRLGRVLFCHATPRDDNEIFTESTPPEVVAPMFEGAGADLVVCGHTHMPFDRQLDRVRIVNAGSVGMPFGRPGASWLLIDESGPQLRHTSYDVEAAEALLLEQGFPGGVRIAQPPTREEMLALFEGGRGGR